MEMDNILHSPNTADRHHQPFHIVVGWDRTAREATRVLLGLGSKVVVVALTRPEDLPIGAGAVEGHPDDSEALLRAGVTEAESVLFALPALEACRALATARTLNPRARLVASIQETGSGPALRAAGAGVTVDAREEAGREMVRLMLNGTPAPKAHDKR